MMSGFHVAQFNTARALAPLDDPRLAEFVARLEHLARHGPSTHAFTFKDRFPAPIRSVPVRSASARKETAA